MTSIQDVERWVENYRHAWMSNDPDDIRSLFADDAVYYFRPNDAKPARGADEIVNAWVEGRDNPGDWKFDFKVLGILNENSDPIGIVQGLTEYLNELPTYDNLWLVRLDGEGRASEFTEWAYDRSTTGPGEEQTALT